jgi:hypothetical protein
VELDQRHQAFIHTYNTTTHQGLLRDRRHPPIPIEVLGSAKGRLHTPEELARHFSQAVVPRTTNRHGCVTLHSYHFYIEEGLHGMQVLLWVSGEQLRAMFEKVVLAEYRCHYDWQGHKHPRGGVLSHALCVVAGHAPPVDGPRVHGGQSREVCEAPGAAFIPSPAIAAV